MEAGVQALGSVVAVWRYPVKSMQGEAVSAVAVTERGVLGDRAYAVRDRATGHIASAKHPRKWSALFACRASFVEPPQVGGPLPPVVITLPDGTTLNSAQPDIDDRLSRAMGREVSLVVEASGPPTREADRSPIDGSPEQVLIRQEPMALAAPVGTFFDYAPLHILTTATLERLHDLYPAGCFDARRFRPNMLIAPLEQTQDFIENHWLGQAVTIGKAVHLRVIDPCPRCVVTTLAQQDLPSDPGILRTVADHNAVVSATYAPGVVLPAVAGVYACVLREGSIAQGDLLCTTG